MDASRSDPRKRGLVIFVSLLLAMLLFGMFAGRPNRGLLAMSTEGRQIFTVAAAAGVILLFYLFRFAGYGDLRLTSKHGMRHSLALVALGILWGTACQGSIFVAAQLLPGPVSTEPVRIVRPLHASSPLWCSYFTVMRTQEGDTVSICMERLAARSDLVPLLGCVPLDAAATLQVTRTFLGRVGSVVEIDDVGKCSQKRRVKR